MLSLFLLKNVNTAARGRIVDSIICDPFPYSVYAFVARRRAEFVRLYAPFCLLPKTNKYADQHG